MVTISVAETFPASVLSVAPFIGTVTITFGKVDMWIRVFLDPESKVLLTTFCLLNS